MWERSSVPIAVLLLVTLPLFVSFHAEGDNNVEPGWGRAELLEMDDRGSASYPDVMFDASGDAIAVWTQSDGTDVRVMANHFSRGSGWGSAQVIDSGYGTCNSPVRIAVNSSGDAIAVWKQDIGADYDLVTNRYIKGVGWSYPETLDYIDSEVWDPRIGMDDSGNAIAVWYQSDGSYYNVYHSMFSPSGGWGSASLLETNDHAVYRPEISMNSAGDAMVVWRQYDGTRGNVVSRYYDPVSGWGPVQLAENVDLGDINQHQVTVDTNGNAMAVWQQFTGTSHQCYSNYYDAATGWDTARLLSNPSSSTVQYPRIASDPSGDFMAVWYQYDGTRYNIHSCRYDAGTGWGSIELVEFTDHTVDSPKVKMDGLGRSLVVYRQYSGLNYDIFFNRHIPGEGWGEPQLVETNANGPDVPMIAVHPSGDAIAVWYQGYYPRFNVWANYYTTPDGTAPVITLTMPFNGMMTEVPSVKVLGMTEPGAKVTVDNIFVDVDGKGYFSVLVPLLPGMNNVTVRSTDAQGNVRTVVRSVLYQDPLDSIREDILALFEDNHDLTMGIEDLKDDLGTLSAVIGNLSFENGTLTSEVASLRENVTAMMGLIQISQARIDSLMERIDDLSADSNTTGSELSILENLVALLESQINNSNTEIARVLTEFDSQGSRIQGLEDDQDSLESKIDSLDVGEGDGEEDVDILPIILFVVTLVLLGIMFLIMIVLFISAGRRNKNEE